MGLLAPLSLVLALGAQLPLPSGGGLSAPERVTLKADQLTYEPDRQSLVARGHAELRGEQLLLRADELTYDQAHNLATARGGVMLVYGQLAAVADELDVDLATQEATLRGGLFMQKKGITPEALMAAKDGAELKALGETSVALDGGRARRLGPDRFEVDGLSFTPCDCKPTSPSWRIEASHADVKAGDRALLTLPIIYVYGIPVFVLPWLDLPLSDRRTGLLIPHPSTSGLNGLSFEQPVFVTLGPSYDLTFTPGYFFGARKTTIADPNDPTGYVTDPVTHEPIHFAPGAGIEGPRLLTEFRYVPSADTHGRATLGLVYDLRPVRDPVDPSPLKFHPGSVRGLRGDASLQQLQELGGGFHDRIDLSVVSDGYYLRDVVTDVLQREDQYLRSSAVLFHRAEDSYAGLEVVLRQDLRYGYSLFDLDRAADGTPLHGPNTFHRLPALRYALPERPLFGPISGSFTAEYARLSPLLSLYGDEGADGLFDPLHPEADGSQGDRHFQPSPDPRLRPSDPGFVPGEREARDRLDLRPRLSAQLAVGRYARVTPYLAWRQDFYRGELTGETAQRGYPLTGAIVDTELSRTFGPKGDVRHAIQPSLELRYVPRVFGQAPPVAYDEVDTAVPEDGLLQAVAEVSQKLWLRQGAGVRELLRLDLGQGFDLKKRYLGDSYARLAASVGWVGLDAVGRYNFSQARLTQISANLNVDDGRGHAVYGRYDRLVTSGPDRVRRGIDALVGEPVVDPGQPAELLVAGARASFPLGLGLRYEALIQPLRRDNRLTQQTLGVSFSPSCDCWRVEAYAVLRPDHPFPDLGFNIMLARFGTFGAGR